MFCRRNYQRNSIATVSLIQSQTLMLKKHQHNNQQKLSYRKIKIGLLSHGNDWFQMRKYVMP